MNRRPNQSAEHWDERAKNAEQLAEATASVQAKAVMLAIAATYRDMAEDARKASPVSVLSSDQSSMHPPYDRTYEERP